MNELNIAELKIGDRVGYYRFHYGTFVEKGFGKVTKINGYGHITIMHWGMDDAELKMFDKHGKERNRRYTATRLCSAEWLEETLAEQAADNAKQRAVKDLLDYIAGRRYGTGQYKINDENKTEMKRLIDNI